MPSVTARVMLVVIVSPGATACAVGVKTIASSAVVTAPGEPLVKV